jgi:excisionase family DNA binding protein
MEKLLLRVDEAAELASVSRTTGYELVASGQWPSITIGRARRVPLDGLRAWIARQAQEQSEAPA